MKLAIVLAFGCSMIGCDGGEMGAEPASTRASLEHAGCELPEWLWESEEDYELDELRELIREYCPDVFLSWFAPPAEGSDYVEAEYTSDVDFAVRLANLPESDLADRDSIEPLVGTDGAWQPEEPADESEEPADEPGDG